MKISKIFLYDEPSVPEIKLDELALFLEQTFHVPIQKRKNIFLNNQQIAESLAATRIFNYRQEFQKHDPTPEEIQFELDSFVDSSKTENIILYDGFEFHKVITTLIPKEESSLDNFHLIFTNKLTCTFDNTDFRYRPLKQDEASSRDTAEIEQTNKGGPIAMADFTIVNDSSLETLQERTREVIAALE